ncbi:MAG: hypothetical protein Q7U59_08415 [Lutibacter sp.]|nr:hypothetical protein [Lutibacter sp.]MDP3359968.1 hypothetical protein [Lutibacter sp.]
MLSIAVAGLLLTACNGKKTEAQGQEGVHQHADGEEHSNHETDTVVQEEFTVGKDSLAPQEAHEHAAGEKHVH